MWIDKVSAQYITLGLEPSLSSSFLKTPVVVEFFDFTFPCYMGFVGPEINSHFLAAAWPSQSQELAP